MINVDIPGFGKLALGHLVLDYNGTLALDGRLLPGVAEVLRDLTRCMRVHVVTADTFGMASAELAGLPVELTITPVDNQADAKLQFVSALGVDKVVAIGNGRNDHKMLGAAALGIALIQREGSATEALAVANLTCTSVLDTLELLRNPTRLVATLRS